MNALLLVLKSKATFKSKSGMLDPQDLFDISIEEVDHIYCELKRKMGSATDYTSDSLLDSRRKKVNKVDVAKIELLKAIVEYRLEELDNRKTRQEKNKRRAELLRVKELRQNEKLMQMNEDDIDKELAELGIDD